jgi:nicotinamidase-related amidase
MTMMKHYAIAAAVSLFISAGGIAAAQAGAESGVIQLEIQHRRGAGRRVRETMTITPSRTAVVVIDMWDRHWCETYTQRVANMVPRMKQTLAAARKLGVIVVHAPSDVLNVYGDAPQRRAMQDFPLAEPPKFTHFDPPKPPGPTDRCECSPDQPCKRKHKAWSRQHPDLEIATVDLIGDCNNGRELFNVCAARNIDTLIYMGVASNMCVLNRSMGILNMTRHGLRTLVMADQVNAISANGIGPDGRPDPNFTPAKGTAQVQRYIEQHVAPTLESRQLIAAAVPASENVKRRPHVVFVIAEREYDTQETLPAFARKYLGNYRCTFCLARADDGEGRDDIKSLHALYDADLMVLSMRRRQLPVTQMDHLERYIRAGKPIVALRVSVVPFQVRGKVAPGHVVWDRFDREVLGCNYQGYNSKSRETGCDVWSVPAAAAHPILDGVAAKFHSQSWIYRQRPLTDTTTTLLMGRWSTEDPDEPVAWTNAYEDARIFYTTLGHPNDFQIEAFNRMLSNAICWTLDVPETNEFGPTNE